MPFSQHAFDEFAGSFLFEPETVTDTVAGIDQNGEAQRKIVFGKELENILRALVFDDLEIVACQAGDEAALFVSDGERHADAGNVDRDAGRIFGLRLSSGFG